MDRQPTEAVASISHIRTPFMKIPKYRGFVEAIRAPPDTRADGSYHPPPEKAQECFCEASKQRPFLAPLNPKWPVSGRIFPPYNASILVIRPPRQFSRRIPSRQSHDRSTRESRWCRRIDLFRSHGQSWPGTTLRSTPRCFPVFQIRKIPCVGVHFNTISASRSVSTSIPACFMIALKVDRSISSWFGTTIVFVFAESSFRTI